MQKVENFLIRNIFLVILLLSIPAIWALFVYGFYGASDDLHIAWLHQMDAALRSGQFPPRFAPDLSFGYGYPLFNFVFPLPFYVAEIFHFLGLSLVDSVKSVFILSIPLSGYFMYKFLKEHASLFLALAGATIYIYTPYRSTDIYIRGAFGEAFAFIFPPLIAYAITKLSRVENIKWTGILGMGIAGLILSHNIMAYMFIPFLLIFAFVIGFNKKIFKGFILGFLISIYFWLPAIVESSLMKYDTVFNFVDHFPTIKQLITPFFGYGASVAGPYDGMSFFMGTINLILIGITLVYYKKLNKILLWGIGMVAISVFMMNFRSSIFWKYLPLIPYFQFPWRFLSLTTFATSILVIVLDKFKYSKEIAIVLVVVVVAINFNYFKPHDFLGRTDDYYINRYIPTPIASNEYLKTGEEYLRLPNATEKRPTVVSPNLSLDNTFEVTTENQKTVDYYKYYFPGWTVEVDGKKVEAYAGKPYGQIEFKVPAGKHIVHVYFGETIFRRILDIVSIASLALTLVIVFKHKDE
ncbi:MAG TPA: hypothetical protein VFI61_01285 [Patescibacteria group bacterium]|nr:hypothetical protein [Patescibacteria group bacterium]